MPTTVVKTIRASGGDYTTLSAWEAANQGDLVAADEIRVAECYNDWPGGLNDAVYLDGSTEDATRYLMITVAPGHRHDGTPGTGFHIRRDQDWLTLVRLNASSRARLEWLDARNGATNGTAYDIQQGWATNCIARGGYRGFGSCRVNSRLVNCLAIGPSSIAAFELTDWQNAQALNCVAAGASYGFRYNKGTGAVLKNCVAYGNTTNYSGTYAAASTNNASSSASDDAPGGSSVWNVTSAAFADAANNDFHLASGSVLIGAGTNLYSDFTTDIDGDTWPSSGAWDIGFDYRVAAGGGVTGTLSVTLENFTSGINGTTTIVGTIAQTMAAFTSAITGTSEVPGTIAATTEAAVGALEGTVGTDGPTGTITGLVEDSMASMAGSTSIVGTMNVTLEENTSSITGTTTVVGQMAASVAGFVSFIYGTSGLQTATNRLLALIGVGK